MPLISEYWLVSNCFDKFIIRLSRFLVQPIGFSMYTIMSSASNDSYTSSFLIWMPFISFSCLIAIVRTSNTMLHRSGESRHHCLVPDLRGKAFSFCPLNMMLAADVSYVAFIMLRYAPSTPTLLSVFIINGYCQMLFQHPLLWPCDFVFHFVYVMYYIYWFMYIIPSLHPWDESHLIMAYDLFNVLLDLVCQYFVEDFSIYVHQWCWPVVFVLCCVFPCFGIRVILVTYSESVSLPCSWILWNSLKRIGISSSLTVW